MGFGAADCDGLGVEVLGGEMLGFEVLTPGAVGPELLGAALLAYFGKGGKGPRGDSTGALACSRGLATSALVETGLLFAVAATQVPARGLWRCSSFGGCWPSCSAEPDSLSEDDASFLSSSLPTPNPVFGEGGLFLGPDVLIINLSISRCTLVG